MRARSLLLTATIVLWSCAALGAAYLFLFPVLFPRPDLGKRLASIDAAIAGGYLSTARTELLELRPMPRGEKDALRVLKRAFLVSRAASDFQLLATVSDRAMMTAGGSPAVRMVAAYARLRTGRLSDAEAAARAGLPAGPGDLVRGEIVLKKGGTWQGSDRLTRELVGLEASAKPSDFLHAAGLVEDRRLNLDAALLSMESGDLAGARSIVASSLQDAAYDEPAALIDYDSGDFEAAIVRLKRLAPRADIDLILADCYQALGRTEQCARALREAVALEPGISWTPYADLALLAEKQGDVSRAQAFLSRGRGLFPGSAELVLASARLEADQGDRAGAIALLDGLVAQRPNDAGAALYRLSLMAPGMSPPSYRAQLWRLFDRLPADRQVFVTLALALIASHDWDGAMVAIHQHETAGGTEDPDSLAIRACVQAMRGQRALAEESLRQASELEGGAGYRYDLALLLLADGNPREALAQLALASPETPAPGAGAVPAARIETLRGRCLLATGDVAAARSAFLKARDLDPHALRPGLELRKLEAPGLQ